MGLEGLEEGPERWDLRWGRPEREDMGWAEALTALSSSLQHFPFFHRFGRTVSLTSAAVGEGGMPGRLKGHLP